MELVFFLSPTYQYIQLLAVFVSEKLEKVGEIKSTPRRLLSFLPLSIPSSVLHVCHWPVKVCRLYLWRCRKPFGRAPAKRRVKQPARIPSVQSGVWEAIRSKCIRSIWVCWLTGIAVNGIPASGGVNSRRWFNLDKCFTHVRTSMNVSTCE